MTEDIVSGTSYPFPEKIELHKDLTLSHMVNASYKPVGQYHAWREEPVILLVSSDYKSILNEVRPQTI